MSSSPAPTAAFINETVTLAAKHAEDRECQGFIADVIRHSGLDYSKMDVTTAEYRVLMPDYSLRSGLRAEALLTLGDDATAVAQLIAHQLAYRPEQLIAAIWSLGSFASLRHFLAELRAVTRYLRDDQDRLIGLVMPCELILQTMDAIEQDKMAAPGQPSLPEQITRQFGLRRKVMLLDYKRRTNLSQAPEDGFLKTLGRTLTSLR